MLHCHKTEIANQFMEDQNKHESIKEWKARNEVVEISEEQLRDGSLTMEDVMKIKTTKVK